MAGVQGPGDLLGDQGPTLQGRAGVEPTDQKPQPPTNLIHIEGPQEAYRVHPPLLL